MSYAVNNAKSVLHALLLTVGTTVAEPATILPLMVHHFSSSLVLVGIFASLLRGGAIAVQLFAAFYAQGYTRVMPYMHRVFFFRFASWFAVGASIYLVGDHHPILTLWLIGFFFFTFSFSAGFGAIYYKEIIAKVFNTRERGNAMANRQFFSALGAIVSGGVTGWVLANFDAPNNYAFLFMISSLIMLVGLIAFGSIHEPPKRNIRQRETSFAAFLRNARTLLGTDRRLQLQIMASLLGYSFLLAMPFVIIRAKETVALTGWMLGGFITVQMVGGMIGNLFLWKRFAPNYVAMLKTAYGFMFAAFVIALFARGALAYGVIFFIFGIGMDGFRNADTNLVLEIAPEDKRPVYVAIQSTIVSLGLFFSIPGGFLLQYTNYTVLYTSTLVMMGVGWWYTDRLGRHTRQH